MKLSPLLLPLLPLLLPACSGDDTDKGAADPTVDTGDADTDADTDTAKDSGPDTDDTDTDTGHDTDTDTGTPASETGYFGPTRIVAVVSTSLDPGAASSVVVYDPADGTTTTLSGLSVRGDAVLDCANQSIFVLETRSSDSLDDRIIRVDPSALTWDEWILGSNFRPVDIEWVETGYWVATYGKPRLSLLDVDGVGEAFVALDTEADGDGLAEPVGVRQVAGKVYVVLARVTQSTGAHNGARLVEVDAATRTITQRVDLVGNTPSGMMESTGESLWVHLAATATSGDYDADGGVEAVNLTTFADEGLVVDDSLTGNKQTAAWFDPLGALIWQVYTASTGSMQAGVWFLPSGSAAQSFPLPNRVLGLGMLDDEVWMGETAFDGSAGYLQKRSSADGAVVTTVAMTGPVRDMVICRQ